MASAAKLSNDRRVLAEELLGLYKKYGEEFGRIEDIKRALRENATDGGENFKEEFAGEGVVKVAGYKDGEVTGQAPAIDIETFIGLPKRRQDKLMADGLVKMKVLKKNPFYGSVTVEVF